MTESDGVRRKPPNPCALQASGVGSFHCLALMQCCSRVVSRPEPHILLFRRPLGTDPVTGKVGVVVRLPSVPRGGGLELSSSGC